MALNLFITIENKSGSDLKIVDVIDADGKWKNKKMSRNIWSGSSVTIEAKKSVSYGPKFIIKIEVIDAPEKRCMVYAELSKKKDNPRCCYLIPDGDYICDGVMSRYSFYDKEDFSQIANKKDGDFYVKVTIGAFVKCNRFIHISDTHIGDEYDKYSHGNKDYSNYVLNDDTITNEYEKHKIVMHEINNEFRAKEIKDDKTVYFDYVDILGIIHTGDIFGSFDEQPKVGNYDAEYAFHRYFNEVYKKIYSRPSHYLKNTTLDKLDYLTSHLFEGVGNHDDGCAGKHKTEVWDDIIDRNDRKWENGSNTVDSRMPSVKTKSGVDVRRKRAHYYWDWHDVRFIQINLSVVDGMFTKNNGYKTFGYNSYDYLNSILEKSKGMPVVLCTHIGHGKTPSEYNEGLEDKFISEEDRNKYYEILRNNKNIFLILQGHTHGFGIKSVEPGDGSSIPVFDAGKVLLDGQDNNHVIVNFWEFCFGENACITGMQHCITRNIEDNNTETNHQTCVMTKCIKITNNRLEQN